MPGRSGSKATQVVTKRNLCPSDKLRLNDKKYRIGSWNVRTLYQAGKLDNVLVEMKRMDLDILGVSEVRWTGNGAIDIEGYKFLYSGNEKTHERGVGILLNTKITRSLLGYWAFSDRIMLIKLRGHPFNISIVQVYAPTSSHSEEEIEQFYDELEQVLKEVKSFDYLVVMGDFNAKLGKGKSGNVLWGTWTTRKERKRGEATRIL